MTRSPSTDAGALIPDQRREVLMRALRHDQVLSVSQLTELLNVSHMTVRRDIGVLEREGRAHSVPGGIRIAQSIRDEPAFETKSVADRAEKRAIAAAASKRIEDGMTVYIDAGTTASALVPHLHPHKNLTVVTNDFATVDLLRGSPHIETIHTGGRLENANRSAVGPLAAEALERLSTDIAFISASSWDLNRGVTTPSESKIAVKEAAIRRSSTTFLLATSSKFGSFGLYDVALLTAFDAIFTDGSLPEASASGIRDLGVELIEADPNS